MALRMPKLERNKAGNWHARKVIPADVRSYFGKREDKPTWPGSLSQDEAKSRFREWLNSLEERIAAARRAEMAATERDLAPSELDRLAQLWTHEQLAVDDEARSEGLSERDFEGLAESIEFAELSTGYALARRDPEQVEWRTWAWEFNEWLKAKGMPLDPSSGAFQELCFQLLKAQRKAVVPVLQARHFGDFVETPPPPTSLESLTTTALFDKWEAANRGEVAGSTIRAYRGKFEAFERFIGPKDIRDLSEDDVYRWAEHRETVDGVSRHSIRNNDISALRSVFGWAVTPLAGRVMQSNVAAGVKLKARRPIRERDRVFTDAEAKAILRAASDVSDDPNNPTRAFGERWCPWLLAYSGARIGELTQLRCTDIQTESGIWVMRLSPEAGSIKDRESRTVPLHAHLLERGFIEFVQNVGSGPLFYEARRHRPEGRATSPAALRQ